MNRNSRFINNIKQNKIRLVSNQPSINNMREGEELLYNHRNGMLIRYRKQNGRLWSSNMTSNGDAIVDKKLITNELEYSYKFTDYRVFMHNFEDDISTDKHYMPWWGTTEAANMDDHRVGFVTPFKMILHKIIIRPDAITGQGDITIRVEKQDTDNTEDIVATAIYDVSEMGAISSDSNFELNKSDFDKNPAIEAGKLCGLSIEASADVVGTNHDWYVTSVWKTFIEI